MLARGILSEHERGQRLSLSVSLNDAIKIDVGDDLAVDDDEIVVGEEVPDAVERAGCPEYLFLVRVVDSNTVLRPVPDRSLY